jgi:hypothetical protein
VVAKIQSGCVSVVYSFSSLALDFIEYSHVCSLCMHHTDLFII